MRKISILLLWALLFSGCASSLKDSQDDGRRGTKKIVLISLDGLRPEFYLHPGFQTPHLKALLTEGARARGVLPIYPTVTYPNHATMITGVRSFKHGILSNHRFTMEEGPTHQWYWKADQIQSPTIWDEAEKAGKKVALIGWPTTVGAKVHYLIPEIFPENSFDPIEIWELTHSHTAPELWKEVDASASLHDFKTPRNRDLWMTDAAVTLLRNQSPDLLLLHLTSVDLAQHFTGRDSLSTRQAIEAVDSMIGRVAAQLDFSRDTLIIVGDHGFRDVGEVLNPNVLFAKKGWITLENGKLRDWKVIGHPSGGQLSIYSKDPSLNPKALDVLLKNSGGLYRVIHRKELDQLGAFPGALCALEPAPGFSFGTAYDGDLRKKLPSRKGEHGFLPYAIDLHTGLVIRGPGIAPRTNWTSIELTQLAPTLAQLLNIPFPSAEAKALDLKRSRD